MGSIKPRISVEYVDNTAVITFTEKRILEESDIRILEESIFSVVEQAEHINLVLDFRNVQFLSSSVLGLLIRVSKKVYEDDGQLKLCHIDSKIYEVFKITRLNKIFDIYKDLDSALGSLRSRKESQEQ